MKKYHLRRDIGMHKPTIMGNFYDNDRGPEVAHILALLKRRTQMYTLTELKELSGFFVTAHDECVEENPEDYSGLERYRCQRKLKYADAALARIVELETKENGRTT